MSLLPAQIDHNGKLKKVMHPAVYLDSSVIIDYWLVEGCEYSPSLDEIIKESEYKTVMRNLLHADKRLDKVTEIRIKLTGSSKTTAIVSPIGILELIEWNAEHTFKELAASAARVQFVQKQGKKKIGDYLKELLRLKREETELQKETTDKITCSTGLDILMSETRLEPSYLAAHGLDGLFYADIKGFSFSFEDIWQESSVFAYLQLGAADIMHLLLAKHLGCDYIASFDNDFTRVGDIVKEKMNVTIISSPEELLALL